MCVDTMNCHGRCPECREAAELAALRGKRVVVTLHKGGYWKGTAQGVVRDVNHDRRTVTVESANFMRARTFNVRNVVLAD